MHAIRNLFRRKLRTAFSVAGVGVGISLMVTLFTFSNDVLGQLTDLLKNDRGDLIAMESAAEVYASRVKGDIQGVAFEKILEDEPNVTKAYPMIFSQIKTVEDIGASRKIEYYGVSEGHPVIAKAEVALDDDDKPMHIAPGEPLIVDDKSFVVGKVLFDLYNAKVPASMKMKVGSQVNLAGMLRDDLATTFGEDRDEFSKLSAKGKEKRGKSNLRKAGVDDAAVASLESLTLRAVVDMPQKAMAASLFFNMPLAQRIRGWEQDNDVSLFLIELEDNTPESKDAAVIELNEKFPHLNVLRSDKLLGGMQEVNLISKFNWAVSIIAAIAGALGVANILILSVNERTREIGLLRALGWSRKRIVLGIMQEGIIITILGAMLGVLFGYVEMLAVIELLDFTMADARIDLELAGMAIAVAFVLGIIASIYPAWRASRLTPMDALRQE